MPEALENLDNLYKLRAKINFETFSNLIFASILMDISHVVDALFLSIASACKVTRISFQQNWSKRAKNRDFQNILQ